MARGIKYSGNPLHKSSPGDFGLNPPAAARWGKTLCDSVKIFKRREALDLLREGLRRGTVSVIQMHDWPKQVWAVTEKGEVMEAQRDADGSYHGYPLEQRDPIRRGVLALWSTTND